MFNDVLYTNTEFTGSINLHSKICKIVLSSRSHLLLRISVCGTDVVSRAVSNGVLTLCDLAGSERIGKTDARGQRLVEAAAINKSLSALGQVRAAHVDYQFLDS